MLKQLYRFLSPAHQNLFLEYKVDFKPRYGHALPPHKGLYDIINRNRTQYEAYLNKFLENAENIQSIRDCKDQKNDIDPCWNNGFLPGLDIVSLYSFIHIFQPKQYVEVGSGNSTKVVAKAKRDFQLTTNIVSIDPHPRSDIDRLSNEIIRKPFEQIDYQFILNLEEGDILFIDNSHRVLPNSDATAFFLDILPYLQKGVIVHIHDIYLPYDYPQFMCDRFYSEQYMLAAFLLANAERYQPILPNFFISEDEELSQILLPIWAHKNLQQVEKHGGSFWLQIK